MGIALEESETGSTVRLDGGIDIGCAAELKTKLVQALAAAGAVAISVEAVTYLDVTAMQLLWAAERKAHQAGTGFGVAGEVPEALRAALAEVGLPPLPVLIPAGC